MSPQQICEDLRAQVLSVRKDAPVRVGQRGLMSWWCCYLTGKGGPAGVVVEPGDSPVLWAFGEDIGPAQRSADPKGRLLALVDRPGASWA